MLKLSMILLCGDVGASNSRLAIIGVESDGMHFKAKEFFKNSAFRQFKDVLAYFQKKHPLKIESACFGVAGPVLNGRIEATNLAWTFDENDLAQFLKIKNCFLINDLLAIAYMRKGELENCATNHNAQSCIIPIQGGGLHKLTTGSEKAIEVYTMLLNKFPDDMQSRYLLNVAYMTLGKYRWKFWIKTFDGFCRAWQCSGD